LVPADTHRAQATDSALWRTFEELPFKAPALLALVIQSIPLRFQIVVMDVRAWTKVVLCAHELLERAHAAQIVVADILV
jgi:hypothetical protein